MYQIKELKISDINKSLFETLGNLRSCGDLTAKNAKEILRVIQSNPLHKIYVAKDGREIIGASTLIIEQKFIRNGSKVGHIEDVVTRKGYGGRGIASLIIRQLLEVAQDEGCYRVTLDCNDKNMPFYKKFGFRRVENEMRLDL